MHDQFVCQCQLSVLVNAAYLWLSVFVMYGLSIEFNVYGSHSASICAEREIERCWHQLTSNLIIELKALHTVRNKGEFFKKCC